MTQLFRSDADLLAIWDAWCQRHSYADICEKAGGDVVVADIMTRALETTPEVDALEALAANHELTQRLIAQEWHAVLAAREAGATWDQIAEASDRLGLTSGAEARAAFLARIKQAEKLTSAADTDLPRYRAAL